jgi:hypothetical protein
LVLVEPAIPTLKLTWPGLKPLTEETRECFGTILQSETVGCTSFEFLLLGSRGPGLGGRALTNSEKFANFMRGLHAIKKWGPFGYDLYEIGPEEARIETYRRIEGDIFFRCTFLGGALKTRRGVCDDTFRLDDMNHAHFLFRVPQIKDVPEIESGVRSLIGSFVTRQEKE